MDSIIQCNPKNKLQEILAKYMGNSAPVPTYHCIPSNEGFYCDLNVTLTVSGITKSWNSRTLKPFARKKDAEVNAASEINIDEIRTFLSEKGSIVKCSYITYICIYIYLYLNSTQYFMFIFKI